MSIKHNITSLQDLLERVNELHEAGGVELPELTNEGAASELFSGKELIDQDGNVVTGTFTIDDELTTQDNLITQLQALVSQKAVFNTVYISANTPTDDIGVDGDFYIVRSGS